eukprot:CAMPEP_0194105120 /NCGR_PEP_ID=MMETSP0150-20130528/5356_1 /TAXON_ID=122233 /ORGANISM="Chaetoceros debilis, Strain MM31A-1" /LENGTH=35 /DNA_ID= /DNA_START= /DNA_END= /DNA_ORIENTATION=
MTNYEAECGAKYGANYEAEYGAKYATVKQPESKLS